MAKLEQKNASTVTNMFKRSKNMTTTFTYQADFLSEYDQSVFRGKLLAYAQKYSDVKNNLVSLKQSNPNYLDLAVKIIKIATEELSVYDIEVPLNNLLSQFKEASFYNKEALDFTREVLDKADAHTSKYFLAVLSYGILDNINLKKQFQAAVPFVKYIISAVNSAVDIDRQKQFMNAVKILINENADSEKIRLLPKIKYVLDLVSKKSYNLDVTKIVYSSVSAEEIENRLKLLSSNIKHYEQENKEIDFTNYLIQNSL